ncbi:MAG: hypothetical protein ACT4PL_13490 [Phycisphaerales bacterium]
MVKHTSRSGRLHPCLRSSARAGFSVLLSMGLLSGLGGCLAHHSVEPIEGATPVSDNPNNPPIPEAIATAVKWVVDRYPPNGEAFLGRITEQPFTINLPVGTRGDVANRICALVAKSASPVMEGNHDLPCYHIGRVWVRGDTATVDIFAPVAAYTPPTSAAETGRTVVDQCVTIVLRTRTLEPYYVQSHRVWPIGSFPTPAVHDLATTGDDPRVGSMTARQARPAPLPPAAVERREDQGEVPPHLR